MSLFEKLRNCDASSPHKTIALAGNPNVGKSTVFNALTGLHQHTGNWPGKTVTNARGFYTYKHKKYALIDLPGTYSLVPHSAEEEVARDFLLFEKPDAVIIVCDATCLMRNLNLVFQTMEVSKSVVLCLNLMDEAKRKHLEIDVKKLSELLGIPVLPTTARKKKGLSKLLETVEKLTREPENTTPKLPPYRPQIETAILELAKSIKATTKKDCPRHIALKLLDSDEVLSKRLFAELSLSGKKSGKVKKLVSAKKAELLAGGYDTAAFRDALVTDLYAHAEEISRQVVRKTEDSIRKKELAIDRFFTGKKTGIPVMLCLLLFVLWLTISGANYPSALLSNLLFGLESPLLSFCDIIHLPECITNALVFGVYRVLAWVVAVMLPPMAIFFPLFSLLEDLGYLPRVAFNLDGCFQKCNACGKQALTMCMGFGCNAVGVTGCRIIDSPRERLIAMLTNCFVPCNGRFPTLIALISMFFIASAGGFFSSFLSALLLTLVILLGIVMSFLASKLLSKTLLRGIPSSFTLELPPYRPPQVGKVLLRSIFDRTLFGLGRAVSVAAPAGLILYLMANLSLGGASLLSHLTALFDPFARLLGLDGVIFTAFILGFPANEIVLPIAIMAYLSSGTLAEMESLTSIHSLLVSNGWTAVTALCTMVFSLMHWPCSTTLISVYKETKSKKWTLVAFLLPTVIGMLLCFAITTIARIFALWF